MKLFIAALFALSAFGQATVNPPAIQLDAAGATYILNWMSGIPAKDALGALKQPSTTLAVAINASATSVTVAAGNGLSAGATINIGLEHMQVTARAGQVLTVIRGFNGTVAASHAIGDVTQELEHKTLNTLGKAIVQASMRQIIANQRGQALNAAAAAQAKAESESSVQ